jgi:hypothetical protein
MRRSIVLSLPPLLVFPGQGKGFKKSKLNLLLVSERIFDELFYDVPHCKIFDKYHHVFGKKAKNIDN